MGGTKVAKKRMSFIRDQNIALLWGFVKSNVWLKDKYTYAFDVSMYNRAFFVRVEVMQSVCYSQDLIDIVRRTNKYEILMSHTNGRGSTLGSCT